jgi:hypothetical protein
MIEQQESYTNNQKQMQNKTTPKKKEKEIEGQAGLLQLLRPSCW